MLHCTVGDAGCRLSHQVTLLDPFPTLWHFRQDFPHVIALIQIMCLYKVLLLQDVARPHPQPTAVCCSCLLRHLDTNQQGMLFCGALSSGCYTIQYDILQSLNPIFKLFLCIFSSFLARFLPFFNNIFFLSFSYYFFIQHSSRYFFPSLLPSFLQVLQFSLFFFILSSLLIFLLFLSSVFFTYMP